MDSASGSWEILLVDGVPLGAEEGHLVVERLQDGVGAGEAEEQLLALQLHLREPLLEVGRLLQRGGGGEREVHPGRPLLHLVALQRLLGGFQVVTEDGDLGVEEPEGLLGLVGALLDVVAEVGLGEGVEDRDRVLRRAARHRHPDEAGELALLGELEGGGQVLRCLGPRRLAQVELGAGAGHQFLHEHGGGRVTVPGGHVPGEGLPHRAHGEDCPRRVDEIEVVALPRDELELDGGVLHAGRDVEAGDLDPLAAPGVPVQAQERRGQAVPPPADGDGASDLGEEPRRGGDVEVQVVHHHSEEAAGLHDLDLGGYPALRAGERALDVGPTHGHEGAVLRLGVHLQEDVGLVERGLRGEYPEEAEGGDGERAQDEPPPLRDGLQVEGERRTALVVAGGVAGRRGRLRRLRLRRHHVQLGLVSGEGHVRVRIRSGSSSCRSCSRSARWCSRAAGSGRSPGSCGPGRSWPRRPRPGA